jgi:hypothetical protein
MARAAAEAALGQMGSMGGGQPLEFKPVASSSHAEDLARRESSVVLGWVGLGWFYFFVFLVFRCWGGDRGGGCVLCCCGCVG